MRFLDEQSQITYYFFEKSIWNSHSVMYNRIIFTSFGSIIILKHCFHCDLT